MSPDSIIYTEIADLLIKGGVGIALIKATWEIGKANAHLSERITAIEKDVSWIRQIIGTRNNDTTGKRSD